MIGRIHTQSFRRIHLLSALALLFAFAAGCAEQKSTIAQVDPYVGRPPPPPQPLQKRPEPMVRQPRPGGIRGGAEPGWVPARGIANRWDCIVIHHSANDRSTPMGMREWHMRGRGWDELGYHFVIGNGKGYGDGTVFVGQRWQEQKHGAHCKTPNNHYNDHGVGICLIGDLDAHPPTSRQMQSLARLVRFLCDEADISRSKILTHGGITKKTACPGRRFALSALMRQLDSTQSVDARDVFDADDADLGIIP